MTHAALPLNRRTMLASTSAAAAAAAVVTMSNRGNAQTRPTGQRADRFGRAMPFSDNWRFRRGEGDALEQVDLDDRGWREVDLPHDWSVEDVPDGHLPDQVGPFDKDAIGGNATGFTLGGEGWYRKHFRVDTYPQDARVEILFGGAHLETDVWLNGQYLGQNVNGYIPFAFDLTPHLDRTGDNVLAVRVRNLGRNTRWYAGSGLYRNVTLDVLPAGARLARWGVGAWTKRIADGKAAIDVSTQVIAPGEGLSLVTRLRDAQGKVVAESTSPASEAVEQTLAVRGAQLWSPKQPNLYVLETELRDAARTLDRIEQPFGIRIVEFDPDYGMSINGTAVRLHGGCIHHDNGLLGACAYADADERRIRLLKARGFNALRSSHNPSSEGFREACDRLGMLLIEEAFDVWHEGKEPDDFAVSFEDHWQEVIPAMVLPARKSPSVIMWSIGNEIPGRSTDEGVRWQWTLANAVKSIDPTRPVTAGLNGVLGRPVVAEPETARPGTAGKPDNASTIFLDIPGHNYRLAEMKAELPSHPERVFYASETFPRNMFDYAALLDQEPRFLGEFVWTAMDYIGEAGIGANALLEEGGMPYYFATFPWINAWCGDLDLLGYQKAQSLARDVVWGLSPLELVVQRPVPKGSFEWVSSWGWSDERESWTWPGHEGHSLAVRVYSSGERVSLLLNGEVVGEQPMTAGQGGRAKFSVPYAAGKLEAVVHANGREIARRTLETAGTAHSLRLTPEQPAMRADNQSLAFVPMEIVDETGRLVPADERAITLEIEGPAELAAFGNAGPFATGSLQSMQAQAFQSRAMAILRSTGAPGEVRLTARGHGLPASGIVMTVT